MLIGYARISTPDQNPDHQIDALMRAGVAERDIHLDIASGSKAFRPKFDLVMQLLRDGDTLKVTRLDRVGRSLLDLVNLGAELREREVGLHVIEQGIDTATAEGRAMFGMLSVLAEYQRELIVAKHSRRPRRRPRPWSSWRPATQTHSPPGRRGPATLRRRRAHRPTDRRRLRRPPFHRIRAPRQDRRPTTPETQCGAAQQRWGSSNGPLPAVPGYRRCMNPLDPPAPVGAIFTLDMTASETLEQPVAGGWSARLTQRSRWIIVQGDVAGPDYVGVLDDAFNAAQEALDILVMTSSNSLLVQEAESQHIAWWTDNNRVIARIVYLSDLGFSASATGQARDRQGNVKPSPPLPKVQWHPSFRYFRLSQATSDLVDAYRNLYLALESALSTIIPTWQGEAEGRWLKRSLNAVAASGTDLTQFVPAGTSDPVTTLFNDIYTRTRTALFHSKTGRPVILPHGAQDRAAIVETLNRLAHLYLRLARTHLGARPPSSGMTYAGFENMTGFDAVIEVTDDNSAVSESDTSVNPAGRPTVPLTTRRAPDLSTPGITFWFAEADRQQLRQLNHIRRVGLSRPDWGLLQIERLKEDLDLGSIDVLQVQLGARLVNRQQPRARYQT